MAPDHAPLLDDEQQRVLRVAIATEEATTTALVAAMAADHAEIVEAQGWSPNDDEHDPEGSTVAVAREQLSALLAQAHADVAALASARHALDEGTYGRCVRCGAPIPFERLEALPTTTTCVACAARPVGP